ncbi:MAG: phosphotransferase [Candidatus Parcubacteria bacterium]|nr:phosphotransferase [Candidatus Parcubacteria bacterium]
MKFKESEIIKLASQYEIGQIKSVEPIKTGGNNSFLIVTDLDQYFLHLCGERHRFRSNEEIEGELDLVDKLKANNFPVIDYLRTKTGERVVNLENYNGYLRKYLTGEFIQGNPSEKQLTAVGKILGEYHRIVANYKITKRDNINFGLDKTKIFFEEHKEEIIKSNFMGAKEFVKVFDQEINQLNFSDSLPQGMIHEDLGKRHVIWQGDKISAIIDFDRSYFGPLLLDLGQALRGWCFIDNWQKWSQENARIFLAGYETERKLSDWEKEYLVPAIKFAILERALSFCTIYIYSDKPELEDEKFAYSLIID